MAPFDAHRGPARLLAGFAVIRVVVTGSECTGKTTLAEALAAHYGTTPVPEYARLFVAEKGAAPVYADVDAIARGQMALEDKHAGLELRRTDPELETAGPGVPTTSSGDTRSLLIQDTDLLSTVVYSKHYYGECPGWIERALRKRAADLYLLAGIDVPWIPDGDQRDRGDRREEMQELFRAALTAGALRYIDVCGTHEQRLRAAVAAIGRLTDQAV